MYKPTRKMPAIHPLLNAVLHGELTEVKVLVLQGTDVNMRAPNGGKRPLHVATHVGNKAMVSTLLELKADPLLLTDSKFSAFHVAAQTGRSDLMLELISAVKDDRKADYINAPSDGGCTPLHESAANGHQEATMTLLSLKANPVLKDSRYNLMAGDLAGMKGYSAIHALLMKATSARTSSPKVPSPSSGPKKEVKENKQVMFSPEVSTAILPPVNPWQEFKAALDKKKKAKNAGDNVKANARLRAVVPHLYFDQEAMLGAGISLEQALDFFTKQLNQYVQVTQLPALIESLTKAIAHRNIGDTAFVESSMTSGSSALPASSLRVEVITPTLLGSTSSSLDVALATSSLPSSSMTT